MNSPHSDLVIRFGAFELDLRSRELRKDGRSTGVPEQCIKVLQMLLARPGELVLREEIRLQLWPNDRVVEFDHSINTAIRKLRLALGDSADTPLYIETLARRGYRWIAPLDAVDAPVTPQLQHPPAAAEDSSIADSHLTGKRVSHYRVLEVLGGGGMGIVYKAEDLKLGRRVALKFLPDELRQDPAALRRIQQEARAASALNHPNVCTIYEIGEHAGCPFIAMEFLEGETLRELNSERASTNRRADLDSLLELAIQVCDGLAAAHARGIIHRDIKPANIFITRNGVAKILDFGVAKLTLLSHPEAETPDTAGERPSGPAQDPALTRTGVNIGTAGYMSPEQVRGEPLDPRTDLFSFGLVLYEMASGCPAFGAATAVLMREAILHSDPPLVRELNPDIPEALALIIHKALRKDRDARYQSAAEMFAALKSLRVGRGHRRRAVVGAVGLALLLIAAWLTWLGLRRPDAAAVPEARLRQLTTNTWERPVIASAVSPDGRYLAYSDSKGMHIKVVGADDSLLVPHSDALGAEPIAWEVNAPAWFPDSSEFVATAHPASEDALGSQPDWSSETASIWAFPVSGSAPHKLRDAARAWFVSPDGTSISFGTRKGRMGERELWLMGPNGERAHKVLEVDDSRALCCLYPFPGGKRASYVATDKSGDTLLASDLTDGPAVTLIGPADMKADFVWVPDGRLIYSDGCNFARFDAVCSFWIERFDLKTGHVTEKPERLTKISGVTICCTSAEADARRIAFQQTQSAAVTYIADLTAGAAAVGARRYTLDEGDEAITDWTPDGTATIIARNRGNYSVLYQQHLGAAAEPILARIDTGLLMNAILSPDAKWVVFLIWPLPAPPGPTPPRTQLWHVPMGGGTPQQLFSLSPGSAFSCARAPASLCVTGEPAADGRQVIVAPFDPTTGERGNELFRYDRHRSPNEDSAELAFALTPDGRWLSTSATPSGPIRILSLHGEPPRSIVVDGLNLQPRAAWTPGGKALIVSNHPGDGGELLQLDLDGAVHRFLKCESPRGCFGVPSPDGRYVAISDARYTSNVWMLERP